MREDELKEAYGFKLHGAAKFAGSVPIGAGECCSRLCISRRIARYGSSLSRSVGLFFLERAGAESPSGLEFTGNVNGCGQCQAKKPGRYLRSCRNDTVGNSGGVSTESV